MRIEPASRRVATTAAADAARPRTHGDRIVTALRCLGFVIGALLLAAGAAITLSALHGLHALLSPEVGPDAQTAFRCGMPIAAAIFGLMITIPVAITGGALIAWCRPTRTQRGR